MSPIRALALRSIPFQHRPLLPEDPLQWTAAELAAWRADLERRGLFDHHVDLAWHNMESARANSYEGEVVFRNRAGCSRDVLAEAPLQWRAARAWFNAPELPLISHDIAAVLGACRKDSTRTSRAAGERILAAVKAWGFRQRTVQVFEDGVQLRGGLRLVVAGSRIRLLRRADCILEAPATDAQLPRLKRLAWLWSRLVVHAVGDALQHAVPSNLARTIDSRLQFALPTARKTGYADAYVVERGAVRLMGMELLGPSFNEGPARRAAARVLAAGPRIEALDQAITGAVDRLDYGIFSSLDPELPDDSVLASSMDDTARAFIRPLVEGRQVAWGEQADAFDVYQDGMCGPEYLGRVPTLAMAVALERGNRRTVTMRLGLAIGNGRSAPQRTAAVR